MVFGHLKVITETKNKKGVKAWLVECDCENKTQLIVETGRLVSGKKTHCGCRRQYSRRDEIEFPEKYLNKYKVCSVCGKEKEYKEFYFKECININSEKQFYFNSRCIECEKETSIDWKHEHRDKVALSNKKAKNKGKVREQLRRNHNRYKENGGRKRWEQNNPDKLKKYRMHRYLHKKHIMYDIEWENCKKYFNYKCAYCGLPIEKHYITYRGKTKLGDFHKEHVIDEGKNDIRNCVPSCNSCNSKKRTNSLNNWYNSSNTNYTYERYYKIYQWIRYDHKKYIMPKRRYKKQNMMSRLKEIENNKISKS